MPDRFHVPISAPTASRMNTALVIEVTRVGRRSTSAHRWPFLSTMSAAIIAQSTSATWIGPSSASSPNRASDPPISATSATSGSRASSRDGSELPRLFVHPSIFPAQVLVAVPPEQGMLIRIG